MINTLEKAKRCQDNRFKLGLPNLAGAVKRYNRICRSQGAFSYQVTGPRAQRVKKVKKTIPEGEGDLYDPEDDLYC